MRLLGVGPIIVWRLRGKIIRTAWYCVVYDSWAQRYAHRCEQFLQFCGLGFVTLGPFHALCVDLCLYFECFCLTLHSCCITVSTVGRTWWDWSLVFRTKLPSVLWHCWLGHLIRKNPSPDRYDLYCVWWDVKACSTCNYYCEVSIIYWWVRTNLPRR